MRAICRSTRRRDRVDLDAGKRLRAPRQRRQRTRQLEVEIVAPEAEHADQRLALARRALADGRELGGNVGVEHLLARLIELVHRPGLAEARSRAGRGFGRLLRLHQEACELRAATAR